MLKHLFLFFFVFSILIGTCSAQTQDICFLQYEWDYPDMIELDTLTCSNSTFPIQQYMYKYLDFIIRWQIKGTTTWQEKRTKNTKIKISYLPCDDQIGIMVGIAWIEDDNTCFDEIELIIPTNHMFSWRTLTKGLVNLVNVK